MPIAYPAVITGRRRGSGRVLNSLRNAIDSRGEHIVFPRIMNCVQIENIGMYAIFVPIPFPSLPTSYMYISIRIQLTADDRHYLTAEH